MPKCKVLVGWGASEGWEPGDVVDISNPWRLIEEGKVELYVEPKKAVSDNADSKKPRASAGSKKSKKADV